MSTIITDMQMPDRCFTCGLKFRGTCPKLIKSAGGVTNKTRLEDCPLKSIEGLIEGLLSHKWNKDEGSKAVYNAAIDDAIIYIKEYCEVER